MPFTLNGFWQYVTGSGDAARFPHSTSAGRSIGANQPQQLARQQTLQPYAIPDRSARPQQHQMEPPPMNPTSSSNRGNPIHQMNTSDVGRVGQFALGHIININGGVGGPGGPGGHNGGNGGDGGGPYVEISSAGYFSNISGGVGGTGGSGHIGRRGDEGEGPHVDTVGGNMTQLSLISYGESGIDRLSHSVVMEALHDSVERFPEPACHPGTRTVILEELKSWSLNTSLKSTILWLHGCAGMGKSAIAQMFSGDCQAQGHLGGSFFFRRGHPKRGTWHGLFTTLAYQLAMSVPELLLPVQQAMDADKLVVGRAMPVQFRKLFLEPLKNMPGLQFVPVIVLDGLDECTDHKVQQQILCLFIEAIRDHHLPIRLLIVSRPEPHLREILEREETSVICHHYPLSVNNSARQDIRIYFRDEFFRIYTEYMARGNNLGPMWPLPETVEHLVNKSSGIFIYATTVIRFIADEYSHPADRLTCVLSLDPRSTAPLDDLYTEILSVVPHGPQQLRILHAIWQGTKDYHLRMDPEQMDSLLDLRPGTSRLALRGLHSLFHVPPICTRFGAQDYVRPLHASLGDYLEDSRRSGKWCVSTLWLASDYLHCVIRLLSSPQVTLWTIWFHWDLIRGLPQLLSRLAPTDTLVTLMRNTQFQDSLFLNVYIERSWPKRFRIPIGSDPTVGRSRLDFKPQRISAPNYQSHPAQLQVRCNLL
ncbi:hypothetical protein FB451DRAFT_723530 [Mycena latifolia]|nr:hypothetical protein FB451DRAFT_723530 [Mycena latifolia]